MTTIHRAAVSAAAAEAVRRLVWADLFRRGLLPDEVDNYRRSASWLPWLRDSAEIRDLVDALPADLRTGTPCEPQLVLHPPDRAMTVHELSFHVDETPPWAHGRRYRRIVGIAVTPQTTANGGLWTWETRESDPTPVAAMDPGDAVELAPDEPHSSGWNLSGDVRIAVYARYLDS